MKKLGPGGRKPHIKIPERNTWRSRVVLGARKRRKPSWKKKNERRLRGELNILSGEGGPIFFVIYLSS